MKQHDVQHFVKYSDTYVASVGDIRNVIASGTSLAAVHTKLKEQNIMEATSTYIPPVDKSITFTN